MQEISNCNTLWRAVFRPRASPAPSNNNDSPSPLLQSTLNFHYGWIFFRWSCIWLNSNQTWTQRRDTISARLTTWLVDDTMMLAHYEYMKSHNLL